MGTGLERGNDEGRQKDDRAAAGQDGLFVKWYFALIEERGSQAAYCLPLMTNMNKCEKEKKCKEQRQQQRGRLTWKQNPHLFNLETSMFSILCFEEGKKKKKLPILWCFRSVIFSAKSKVLPAHTHVRSHKHTHVVLSKACLTGKRIALERKWSIRVSQPIYLLV